MLGISFVRPAPRMVISPLLAIFPTRAIFWIKEDPVGLEDVNIPSPTYKLSLVLYVCVSYPRNAPNNVA